MHTDHATTKRIALVVLTRAGLALALRLQRGLATDVTIYASHRASSVYDAGDKEGGCTIHQGRHKAPTTHPCTPDPYGWVPPLPCDDDDDQATETYGGAVGVGGMAEAGRGPCADPGSPSTPTLLVSHHANPRGQAQGTVPTDHLILSPENELHSSITRFETVAPLLNQLWTAYDQIVLFFALGAVVRLIAPLLRHKHIDPGIVAIDDAGRFAISVVSGHIGDANGLALRCAEVLGATPVVTTASEVHGTLAVDLLAHTQGWQVEDPSAMTAVSAAIVNGEAVAILQTCGDLDWWKNTNPWPSHLLHVTNPQEVSATRFAALLVISDHLIEGLPLDIPTLVYRPPTLVLGIGCRRGISFDTLDSFVKATLAAHRLAIQSVAILATADIKADEAALQMLVQRYGWSLETHAVTALRTMTEVPNPSQRVQRLVGTPSVCEAAALLSSNGDTLIVSKQKGEGMTLAVARKAGQVMPEKGE